jgi:hypothetical protein
MWKAEVYIPLDKNKKSTLFWTPLNINNSNFLVLTYQYLWISYPTFRKISDNLNTVYNSSNTLTIQQVKIIQVNKFSSFNKLSNGSHKIKSIKPKIKSIKVQIIKRKFRST